MKNNTNTAIGVYRETERRRKICNACKFRHPVQKTCMKCGCPIEEMTADMTRTCSLSPMERKW